MSSSTTPQKNQTSALTEVLNNWKAAVLDDHDIPPNKSNENLQHDAQTFFRYISSNTQIEITGAGVILETRSSHEEALARLIQDLGPAFTTSAHPQRLRGLYVLLGAIEGCRDTNISNKCLKSLGDFLLLQCGPIVDDEYEEDYDSMIRDVCVKALTALVETPTSGSNSEEIADALEQRSQFAIRGVERRCAAPDDMEQDAIDPYGAGAAPRSSDIRGGLSMLPRSKRSLCFDLLRGAVVGITKINTQIESSNQQIMKDAALLSKVQRHLVQFTEFSTRCIPGESDPRCLLQLLELLHSIQVAFQDWFQTVQLAVNVFPHEDVFESVVPYYPIQFTPPPNNIHAITREGLHSELAAVLTCTKMDEAARKHRKPTMLGCSTQLFLEQLLPTQPDEDMPPSSLEKLEALDCLSTLLFPGKNGGESGALSSECKFLSVNEVRSLSGALRYTHDEASLGVRQGGSKGEADKVLADSCRDIVSSIARELENSESNNLWKAFVSEPLDKDIKKLQLSPSYAKTAIAYEACLCASGGPKTLRVCLSKGLGPLLQFLKEKPEDSEDYLAAIHGLSAFFSSTKVALSKLHKNGVEITPHPLEPYAEKACILLLNTMEKDSSYSLSTKAAAATALECLFSVATKEQLDSEDTIAGICNFFEGLIFAITSSKGDESDEEFAIAQSTFSRVLGELIGRTLDAEEMGQTTALNLDDSILSFPQIQDFVEHKIFPSLEVSAFGGSTDEKKERYDRRAMSIACSLNARLADSIVRAHVTAFYVALTISLTEPATLSTLEALSYIIQKSEGSNVVRAFHEDKTVDEILDALSNKLKDGTSARLRASIAQIALPATMEEQESLMSKANAVRRIESSLIPAYNNSVPKERLSKLFKDVSQKIPPLSKADECDLFVRLPLLGAALQSASSSLLKEVVAEVGGDDENALVVELLKGLSEYAMSSEHLASARTAAASCVYGLVKGGFDNSAKCPARPLAEDVMNRLTSSSGDVGSTQNCLNLLSLLGQAGAIRGSSSSSTADGIARFLVEVACEQNASIPFQSQGLALDLASSFKEPEEIVSIQISAATAYGAMLVIDGIKPLMKQRLTHASLKFVKKTYELESSQAQHDEPISAPSTGQLLVVCHVICSTDLSRMDRATTHMIATVCVEGFSSDLFQVGKNVSKDAAKARTLVVCAALNLICTIPAAVNGFVLTMVAGLLRAYAVTDPETEIGCKLVVLQSLEKLSNLVGAKATIVTVKPAVLAILAVAMNQKSGLLRSAAVDVRNAWCLVE